MAEDPSDDEHVKEGTNLMWSEKYRPIKLTDVISHQDMIGTITNLICCCMGLQARARYQPFLQLHARSTVPIISR